MLFMKDKNINRHHIIDLLRGLLFISVVIYHILFDLVYMFGANLPWFSSGGGKALQIVGAGGLILISGMSSNFSRSNIKRGIKVFMYGMALTVGTLVLEAFGIELFIWFGVLHLIGVSGIVVGSLEDKFLSRIPPAIGAAVSVALFAFTYGVSDGFVGLFGVPLVKLPTYLYSHPGLEWLGFVTRNFSSSDFFPIFPNLFLFLAGYFLWRAIKLPDKILSAKFAPVNFVGRHTLVIYLVHQPVIYGILWVVFLCIN